MAQLHEDIDSDALFDLPDGFRLDDFLTHPEALDACLTGWERVGEREPVEITGRAA